MRLIKIDFMVQTIIICPLALFFFFNLFTGHVNHIGPYVLYSVIALGLWQLVSSIVIKEPYLVWRRIYLISSLIYLVAVIFFPPLELIRILQLVIAIPPILVLLYYYITLRSYRSIKAEV